MKLETQLKDRVLRFDGSCAVDPEDIAYFIYHGVPPRKLLALREDPQVDQFNDQVAESDSIKLYDSAAPISIELAWQVPQEFLDIELLDFFTDVFAERVNSFGYTDQQFNLACDRIQKEIVEIEERGMVEFMQTVIYIIDTFKKTGQVWGVGRGSSCACYLLFLAGLHVVDCIKLDVPMDEFFHD